MGQSINLFVCIQKSNQSIRANVPKQCHIPVLLDSVGQIQKRLHGPMGGGSHHVPDYHVTSR